MPERPDSLGYLQCSPGPRAHTQFPWISINYPPVPGGHVYGGPGAMYQTIGLVSFEVSTDTIPWQAGYPAPPGWFTPAWQAD
jgi:hypothetical protein